MSEAVAGMIMIALIGAVFAGVGIHGLVHGLALKKRCNNTVGGIVSSIHCSVDTEIDDSEKGTVSVKRGYFPEFSYIVGGIEYTHRSHIGRSYSRFNAGDCVTVYYDPEKPEICYVIEDKEAVSSTDIVFTVFGIIIIIMGIVLPPYLV